MQAIYRQRAGESSIDASSWARDLFFAAGLAFVYFILARASLFFVTKPEGVSAVWPPTGFALAVLLLTQQRRRSLILLGIFVANLIAHLISGNSLPVSLGFAVVNSAGAVLATWLLNRFFHPPITFDHLLQVIGLFAVTIPSAAVTTFLGAAVSTLALGADYSHVWFTWWIADTFGMLLVTPLMVMWAVRPTLVKLLDPFAIIEAVLLFGALTAFSWLLFFAPTSVFERLPLSAYMTLPFLIWALLRFSPRIVMVGLTYLSFLGIAGTILGYGYFAQINTEPFYPVLMVHLFLAVLVICALVLSVVLSERQPAHRLLRVNEKELRTVLQTTMDGSWIMDSAGHLLDVNDAYCTTTGYDRAELLKTAIADLETERTSADLIQSIQTVIEKGTDRFETCYQRKDGTLFDVEISATWVPERGGQTFRPESG